MPHWLKYLLSKRYRDACGAAQFDYLLDHPEADPAYWEAHDEIMLACYPLGRTR
jgi:hypothetical protein